MDKPELFDLTGALVELIKQHQKTGTLIFKDMTQKLSINRVYKEIYPKVKVELACDSCVLHALNMILSWHEKNYPAYQKTLSKPSKAVETIAEPIPEAAPKPQPQKGKKNGK